MENFDMNIPVIFQFLKNLSANNNREWFQTHRDNYETARTEFERLLSVVISRISLFDSSVSNIEAKDCTYRIYRDTRFTEDKTPYKRHLGGYINAKGKNHFTADITSILNLIIAYWPAAATAFPPLYSKPSDKPFTTT